MRTAAPTPKRPRVDTLPDFLKSSSYCLWRYEWVQEPGKDGRWNKTPYQAAAPREKARVNDPATFSPLPFTWGVYQKNPEAWAGIGTRMAGDMVGIDIDHCVDESGKLSEMVREIVDLMDSYTEISPSGSGIRIFTFVSPDFVYGDQYYKKNSPIGLEVYRGGATNRFLTVTGDRIREGTRATRGEQLQRILDKYMRRPEKPTKTTHPSVTMSPLSLDDQQIVELAQDNDPSFGDLWEGNCSRYGNDHSAADSALCSKLAFYTKDRAQIDRIFRRSGLMREKWDSERNRATHETYGSKTIDFAIEWQSKSYNPVEYAKAKQEEEEKRIQQGIEKRQQAKQTGDQESKQATAPVATSSDGKAQDKAGTSSDGDNTTATTPQLVNMADYVSQSYEAERQAAAGSKPTGFPKLDEKLGGGFHPGLHVLTGGTGMGKTTFMLQMADNMAASGIDVIYISLEMARLELVSKSISRLCAQRGNGGYTPPTALKIRQDPTAVKSSIYNEYKANIAPHLYVMEGNFSVDVDAISDTVREFVKTHEGARPVVFVDYLQIITPTEEMTRKSTRDIVTSNSVALRQMARDLNVPVVVVSAMARKQYDTPITFDSLKESGGIEYTSDTVLGLEWKVFTDNFPNYPLMNADEEDGDGKRKVFRGFFNIAAKFREIELNKAKRAQPRRLLLRCIKTRDSKPPFEVAFEYDSAHDLFTESQTVTEQAEEERINSLIAQMEAEAAAAAAGDPDDTEQDPDGE